MKLQKADCWNLDDGRDVELYPSSAQFVRARCSNPAIVLSGVEGARFVQEVLPKQLRRHGVCIVGHFSCLRVSVVALQEVIQQATMSADGSTLSTLQRVKRCVEEWRIAGADDALLTFHEHAKPRERWWRRALDSARCSAAMDLEASDHYGLPIGGWVARIWTFSRFLQGFRMELLLTMRREMGWGERNNQSGLR